jgi:hypothetical protein
MCEGKYVRPQVVWRKVCVTESCVNKNMCDRKMCEGKNVTLQLVWTKECVAACCVNWRIYGFELGEYFDVW